MKRRDLLEIFFEQNPSARELSRDNVHEKYVRWLETNYLKRGRTREDYENVLKQFHAYMMFPYSRIKIFLNLRFSQELTPDYTGWVIDDETPFLQWCEHGTMKYGINSEGDWTIATRTLDTLQRFKLRPALNYEVYEILNRFRVNLGLTEGVRSLSWEDRSREPLTLIEKIHSNWAYYIERGKFISRSKSVVGCVLLNEEGRWCTPYSKKQDDLTDEEVDKSMKKFNDWLKTTE